MDTRTRRWTLTFTAALLACGLGLPVSWAAPGQDGRPIMEQVDRKSRSADEVVELTMRLHRGGTVKERRLTMTVQAGPRYEDKTLLRFSAPGDLRDTGFLIHQHGDGADELWMYVPALRKVKRLAATERRDPFVGSDFANEDLRTENLLAYDYQLLRQEPCGAAGGECQVLQATPASKAEQEGSGYSRRLLWVSADSLVQRIDYFSRAGGETAVKTLVFEDYRTGPTWKGFSRASRAVMTSTARGTRTELLFDPASRRIDAGIDGGRLSQRGLQQP